MSGKEKIGREEMRAEEEINNVSWEEINTLKTRD